MAAAMSGAPGGSEAGMAQRGGAFRGSKGRSVWESSLPTATEVEALMRRFPEEISVPEDALRSETENWVASGVIARSLGGRVSVDAVIREIRRRIALRGDLMGSFVQHGVFVLKFTEPIDRDAALRTPWTVAGQVIAVEPWRPGLIPSEDTLTSAKIWVRLPCLPVEFWSREALREVLRLAGELVAVDDWTESRRRLGFARVCLQISLSQPLRPGVTIRAPGGTFWQTFVYENADGVCLSCGRFHGHGLCPAAGVRSEGGGLSEGNIAQQEDGMETGDAGPVLGAWSLAVRRWLPAPDAGKSVVERAPSRRLGKEPAVAQPGSGGRGGPESEWLQPSKVARRILARRPTESGGSSKEGATRAAGRFGPLDGMPEEVESGTKEGGALTKSTFLASPETQHKTREQPGRGGIFQSKGSALQLLGGPSKGEGSTPSKRARAEDGTGTRSMDLVLVAPRSAGGPRKSDKRKTRPPKVSLSSIESRGKLVAGAVPSDLFIFEAGQCREGEEREGVPAGPSCSSDMTLDHDDAVRLVQLAIQGTEMADPPVDASGGATLGQDQSAGSGETDSLAC